MIEKPAGSESDETKAAAPADVPAKSSAHSPHATGAVSGQTVQLVPRARAPVDLPTIQETNYDRENEIARGGMGRIVAAWDLRLGRPVAIKELLRSTPDLRQRFEREAVMTARLQHPAIINIYEAGRWPAGEPFYAMKRVDGRSLADAIQATPSFDQRLSLLPNLIGIVEAMAYAHGQRVIHRDLKPANVLLGSFGESVVIDWGLAKDVSVAPGGTEDILTPLAAEAGLTVSGTVMGTPAYMPPEQARGEALDERADVYALGAILYHLLAGQAPYSGQSSGDVLKQVLASAPRPLDEREPGVAPDLLAIVRKAMAREASQRYPTAKELAEDLKRFQTGQLVGAHIYTPRELAQRWLARHRAPASIAVIAAVALVVAGILAVQGIARERNEAQSARRDAESRNAELVLNQARSSLHDDPTSAIAWLKNYPLDGPAWGAARIIAADARSQGVATRILRGHEHRVNAIAFSPDGRVVASGANDKTVRVWDIATGTSRVLKGPDWFLYTLAFSPDGRWLASIGGSTLWLWEVTTGQGRPQRGQFVSRDVAFSPDSRTVAAMATDDDGPFVLQCDTHTGFTRVVRDPSDKGKWRRGPKSDSLTLAFSPDGGTLFTRTDDDVLRQWDLKTGLNRRVPGRHAFALSRDGRLLATASRDGEVSVRNLESGRERPLADRSGPVSSLAFSPDGQWIASGSEDSVVRLWNLDTGRMRALPGHSGEIHRVIFSPDSHTLVTSASDSRLRLWDVASAVGRELRGHSDDILDIALSPDGRTVASASADRSIRLWSTRADDHQVLFRPDTLPEGPLGRIAFGPRGRVLAAAWDSTIHFWDLEAQARRELKGTEGSLEGAGRLGIDALAFSSDGKSLAAASADRSVRLWNLVNGEARVWRGHGNRVLDMAFSPDDSRLASASMDRTVRLWEVATGESRVLRGHENPVGGVTFSPDGRWIASSSIASRNDSGQKDLDLQLWEASTGAARTLSGHQDTTTAVRFSPDGRTLASGSMDTTVRLWDALTGRVSTVLKGDGSQVFQLAWSPDGRWLATGNEGRTSRVWDLHAGGSRLLKGARPVFSADGATLAVSDLADGEAGLWDVATGEGRVLQDAYSNVAISADGKLVAAIGKDGAVHLWKDDLPRDPAALRAWFQNVTRFTVGSPVSETASDPIRP